MRGLMEYLFSYGAKELHMRVGCPPVLYNCKYLNFTRSSSENEPFSRQAILSIEGADSISDGLIAQYADPCSKHYRIMLETIRKNLNFTTLEYHSLDGMLDSVGIDKCKLCTYCWNGNE